MLDFLEQSRFRRAYAIHTEYPSRGWLPNFVSRRILEPLELDVFLTENEIRYRNVDGGIQIMDWEEMSASTANSLLAEIFKAQEMSGLSVRILKNSQSQEPRLPDEAYWEYRVIAGKKRYFGLEFKTPPDVQGIDKSREWFKSLLIGLNLTEGADAGAIAESEVVHLHIIPDFISVSRDRRREAYEGWLGYFGDLNDAGAIYLMGKNFSESVGTDGKLYFDEDGMVGIFQAFMSLLTSQSIRLLREEIFRRLGASEDGVSVSGREEDLDVSVDSNFPKVFKLLPVGLRGLYAPPVAQNKPIPTVGIEFRNFGESTLSSNIREAVGANHELHLSRVLGHRDLRARGITTEASKLEARAKRLGIHPRFFSLIHEVYLENDMQKEAPEPSILSSLLFFPLTDWLQRPVVDRALKGLGELERATAVERYQAAMKRYVARINDLVQARMNPRQSYEPQDWLTPIRQFGNGYNRVGKQINFRSPTDFDRAGHLRSNPDLWFLVIAHSESLRFAAESGLMELVHRRDGRPIP
jgi:hypothetical protein